MAQAAGKCDEGLPQSEQYYRALIENALDIITVLDANGTIRYTSPAVERVLGYRPEERPGKRIRDFVHPDDLAVVELALAGTVQTGCCSSVIEFRYRHQDGSWRILEATARSLLHDPAVRGIIVSSRDVTERRQAQEIVRQKETALRDSQAQFRVLAARLLMSQEEERARMARELHDDLNQKLAFLAVEAEKLVQRLSGSPDLIRKGLKALARRAADLSEDIRCMAHRLHPPVLDDLGLEPALRFYCADFSRLEGISVKLSCRGLPESLRSEVALCIYRVVQEALRNVAKHSRALQVTVTVRGQGDAVRLFIADPGVGFHPDEVKGKGGLGIASMEERVRLVNGNLLIDSVPGKGTRIEAQFPLERRADENSAVASGR